MSIEQHRKLLKELKEAKSGTGYELHHKTLGGAIDTAISHAKKQYGIEITDDERMDQVGMGPRKPANGKTNSYRLMGSDKSGKERGIQVQVYNMGNKYELNMYKESVELDEKKANFLRIELNSSADVKKVEKWISDNLGDSNPGFMGMYREGQKSIAFEDVDDAEDLMGALKTAGFKFKVDHREEVDLDEKKSNLGRTLKLVNKIKDSGVVKTGSMKKEENPLDMGCWDGYKKDGTKPGTGKNKGKQVNNCVPEDTDMDERTQKQSFMNRMFAGKKDTSWLDASNKKYDPKKKDKEKDMEMKTHVHKKSDKGPANISHTHTTNHTHKTVR